MIGGKLERKGGKIAKSKSSRPNLERDGITITLYEMEQVVASRAQRSLTTNFAKCLVQLFLTSTKQMFTTLVSQVAAECGENVPDTEKQLAIMKSGYIMEENIPTKNDVKHEKNIIRERQIWESTLHCIC